MSERTVLASFYSSDEATKAQKEIQQMGIEVAQVDQLHAYQGTDPNRDAFLISGKIPSIANVTLGTNPMSRDAGILLGADPAASGMSDGDGNITGRNYLLTVVCNEVKVDSVVDCIKRCNGFT